MKNTLYFHIRLLPIRSIFLFSNLLLQKYPFQKAYILCCIHNLSIILYVIELFLHQHLTAPWIFITIFNFLEALFRFVQKTMCKLVMYMSTQEVAFVTHMFWLRFFLKPINFVLSFSILDKKIHQKLIIETFGAFVNELTSTNAKKNWSLYTGKVFREKNVVC